MWNFNVGTRNSEDAELCPQKVDKACGCSHVLVISFSSVFMASIDIYIV
jgi:hypothetical protein